MTDTSIYDDAIAAATAVYDVPASWIRAIIGTETSFQSPAPKTWEPAAGVYSYGPMQVLLSTARALGFTGTAAQLAEPAANIAVGTELLAQLRARYGDDFRRIYSAYNAGDPDRWTVSSQVSANVQRALTWLAHFENGTVSEDVFTPFAAAGVAVLIGLWWRERNKQR